MADSNTYLSRLIEDLEKHETFVWRDIFDSTTFDDIDACGAKLVDIDGGIVTIASKIDVLVFNRAVGLGINCEIGDDVIENIIAAYKESGARRFFVQVAPTKFNSGLPQKLRARGFKHYNNWVKLHHRNDAIPGIRTSLRILQISSADSASFVEIVCDAFGWPDSVKPWMEALVGRRGWSHYMALDGDTPVATGAMLVMSNWAWFGLASTHPGYRGQGAQSALLQKRIEDAKALGCSMISLETAEDTVERDAPSFRNVQRLGFQVAYVRPNYLMTLKP